MTENWVHQAFQSGTEIVKDFNTAGKPHYYVYADNRHIVCEELADYLNEVSKPPWIEKLQRTGEEYCDGPDGIHILAVGPYVLPPDDNGALAWQQDDSEKKQKERIKLIDRLVCEGVV
jgi:hypothetical protein